MAKAHAFYMSIKFGTARNFCDEIDEIKIERKRKARPAPVDDCKASASEITKTPDCLEEKHNMLRKIAEIILAENPVKVAPDPDFFNVVQVQYSSEKSVNAAKGKLKLLPKLVTVDPAREADLTPLWQIPAAANLLTAGKEPKIPKKDCCKRGECGKGLCTCSKA
ncbi:MAG: hypothetical protein WC521_09055 [Bdellovibrionales bacterium]